MNAFEIPLQPQNQSVAVTLANVNYRLVLQWRNASSTWFLDLQDANGNPIINGIPLVQGSDLLGQYSYLGIGGGLVVVCDTGTYAPTFDNLGITSHLLFITP